MTPLLALPPPTRDAAAVRRVVREVLARPEFRRPAPSPFERARRWLRDQAARLLGIARQTLRQKLRDLGLHVAHSIEADEDNQR